MRTRDVKNPVTPPPCMTSGHAAHASARPRGVPSMPRPVQQSRRGRTAPSPRPAHRPRHAAPGLRPRRRGTPHPARRPRRLPRLGPLGRPAHRPARLPAQHLRPQRRQPARRRQQLPLPARRRRQRHPRPGGARHPHVHALQPLARQPVALPDRRHRPRPQREHDRAAGRQAAPQHLHPRRPLPRTARLHLVDHQGRGPDLDAAAVHHLVPHGVRAHALRHRLLHLRPVHAGRAAVAAAGGHGLERSSARRTWSS